MPFHFTRNIKTKIKNLRLTQKYVLSAIALLTRTHKQSELVMWLIWSPMQRTTFVLCTSQWTRWHLQASATLLHIKISEKNEPKPSPILFRSFISSDLFIHWQCLQLLVHSQLIFLEWRTPVVSSYKRLTAGEFLWMVTELLSILRNQSDPKFKHESSCFKTRFRQQRKRWFHFWCQVALSPTFASACYCSYLQPCCRLPTRITWEDLFVP
jgi:hypothetical protein